MKKTKKQTIHEANRAAILEGLWMRRLTAPGIDTIKGEPVLPYFIWADYAEEANFWTKKYGYLCVETANGKWLLARPEACAKGIKTIAIKDA